MPLVDEDEKRETFGLIIILKKVLTSIPCIKWGDFDWKSLLEETLREEDVGFPIVVREVDGDLLQEVIEGVQTKHYEEFEGMIEDAVLVDLEDIL